MSIETIIATGSSIATGLAVADRFIAKSERIIQDGIVPFIRAVVTNQPIRKGVSTMSGILNFVTNLKAELDKALPIIDEIDKTVNRLAKIAEVVAPFTGQSAGAVFAGAKLADTTTTALDTIIQNHESAGGTVQASVSAAASTLQTLATDGVVTDPVKVAKLNQIATVLNSIPPDILAGIQGA